VALKALSQILSRTDVETLVIDAFEDVDEEAHKKSPPVPVG
jgi:hypothetical protein